MKKTLSLLLFFFLIFSAKAQNSFPFSCNKDTTLDCSQNCITVNAIIPNVKSNTTGYSVNLLSGPNGCFTPYSDPATPGASASLTTDDVYSSVVNMPFNFPFFEKVYRKLVISTNGIVSFDSTNATQFSEYAMLNSGGGLVATGNSVGQNLPSVLYDRALIMGPFHDIDIGVTTSANRKIKYEVIGTAPHRKWILSFYKIPLFLTACNGLFENTHQIVLYEGLGIVEVFVFSKQICTGWNDGRAMIGMQNFARDAAVMAPGRRASDPRWGTPNMNESWRFTPAVGQPLFKKVELLDIAGNIVSTGDTTDIGNGQFSVSFPNVCTSTSATFLVKSTYKKFDDPTVEVYGLDTFRVIRTFTAPPITFTTVNATCAAGNTGNITVTSPLGANYLYSIGGAFQSSPIFSPVVGTYTVSVKDPTSGCTSTSPISAIINSVTTLTATADSTKTACVGSATGTITVNASLGTPPYTYSLDNNPTFVPGNVFTGVVSGSHTVAVKDAGGCVFNVLIKVLDGTGISTSATSRIATCPGAANGNITVTVPTNGLAPYTYAIYTGTTSPPVYTYGASNVFPNLVGGTAYPIAVKDANGCTFTFSQTLNSGPAISATTTAISAACNGINSGVIVINSVSSNAISPFLYSVDGGTPQPQSADSIKNLSGGVHSVTVTDAIGCTVTFPKTVGAGAGPGFSYRQYATSANCAGAKDGKIAFTITSINGPFQVSVDSGRTWLNTVDTVRNLAAGNYTIAVKDRFGCISYKAAIVNPGPVVGFTLVSIPAACPGAPSGMIIVKPTSGTRPYKYTIDRGINFQTDDTIRNVVAGTYTVQVFDSNGCTNTKTIAVTSGTGITATAVAVKSACAGVATGKIIVTPTSGIAPYKYSLDAGATPQPSNIIPNLASGTYTVTVEDSSGCKVDIRVAVADSTGVTATVDTYKSACAGIATGQIIITPGVGQSPFKYSTTGDPGLQFNNTFQNLASGPYTVLVTDFNGCKVTKTVTIADSISVSATTRTVNSACSGAATGKIIVTPGLGVAPFKYSINAGASYQLSDTFFNKPSGTYSVLVVDANGCRFTTSAVIGDNVGVTGSVSIVKSACTTASTGKIIVRPNLGTAPFKYSLSGGTITGSTPLQANDTFPNLISGTYSVTIFDANNCSVSIPAIVTDSTGVTGSVSIKKSACATASTGKIIVRPALGTAPFKYSLSGGTITGSTPLQANDTFPNLISGTYSVTIFDANNCSVSIPAIVTDSTGVTGSVSIKKSACATASTGKIIVRPALGTAPFKYSLSGGTITGSTPLQANDTFPNLISGTYSVTIFDANNCSVSIPAIVKDSTGVTGSVSVIKSACAVASTGKIIVRPALGTAPFKYSLSGGTITGSTPLQANDTFPNLKSGTYSVTIFDANNCSVSVPAVIADSTGATATAQTVQSACAAAATGKIIVVPGLGTSPFQYAITGGYQLNDTFPNLAANTYTVRVLDANSCPFSFSATVGNLPVVLPSVNALKAACSGAATGTFIIKPNPGTGTSPFVYSTDNGLSFPYTDTIRNLAANSYNLALKDANNCVVNFTGTITNNIGVRVNIVIDKASCAIIPNGKITINPTAGISPFSYALDAGLPQPSNQFPALFSGTYVIHIKDSALCALDTSIVVGNAARVVVDSLTIVRPSCNGLTDGKVTVYPRLGIPPYKYALNSGTYQTGNISNGYVFNNIGASSVSDTVHIMDNSGCVKDTIIVITQPTILRISTASVAATCTGNPDGKVTVTGTGGTTPYLYSGSTTSATTYTTTPDFPLVKGTYNFTVKDAKGCIATKVDSVLLLDTMRLELGPDTTICAESQVVLLPQTNAATNIFKWTPSAGLSSASVKNPSASPAATTKYYLTATWGVCQRADSITVNVLLRPMPHAGNDTAVCFKAPGTLYGSISNASGPVSYLWSPATYLSNTNSLVTNVAADTNGLYTYTLTVKDLYGCNFSTDDKVVFNMLPVPVAFAGNDTVAVLGAPHQLMATGGATYLWTWSPASTTLNYNNVYNPLATITQPTTFVVDLWDIAGCHASDTVKVIPYEGPNVYLPNAFAPDGQNKTFKPRQVGMKSLSHFTIYNRYGQVVFETSQWDHGWDGTFKGQRQGQGAYVWVLRCVGGNNGRVYDLKGTVVLVR